MADMISGSALFKGDGKCVTALGEALEKVSDLRKGERFSLAELFANPDAMKGASGACLYVKHSSGDVGVEVDWVADDKAALGVFQGIADGAGLRCELAYTIDGSYKFDFLEPDKSMSNWFRLKGCGTASTQAAEAPVVYSEPSKAPAISRMELGDVQSSLFDMERSDIERAFTLSPTRALGLSDHAIVLLQEFTIYYMTANALLTVKSAPSLRVLWARAVLGNVNRASDYMRTLVANVAFSHPGIPYKDYWVSVSKYTDEIVNKIGSLAKSRADLDSVSAQMALTNVMVFMRCVLEAFGTRV